VKRVASVIAIILTSALGAAPDAPSSPTDLRLPGVRERLAALDPAEPMAYFELAEEIAAEFPDESGRRRAEQLFVLTLELSRREQGAEARIGPSVFRALAALSDDPFERRWLTLLSGTGTEAGAGSPETGAIPGALDAAGAIGAFRAADAPEARRHLARAGVQGAIDATAGAVPRFAPMAPRLPDVPACPTCRNRLILKPAIGADVQLQICPTCRGNPGPALSPSEFLATLQAEDLLIDPTHRRWSAQLLLGGGAPITEAGARDLAGRFVVDPARPYFHPVETSNDPLAGTWSDRRMTTEP